MQLSISQLVLEGVTQIHTDLSAEVLDCMIIDHIMYDSRMHNVGKESLFIGLGGDEKHVEQARQKGVRVFLVHQLPEDIDGNEVFIHCDNVLDAFQSIASSYRKNHQGQYIGITGSNGKTITKEWIYTILDSVYESAKSPASYNSQLGVPLSLLGIEKGKEVAIIEAGISRHGEMNKLEQMIQPEIGILTTMGDAHSEGFASFEEKLKEKIKLFKSSKKVIFETTESVNEDCFSELSGVELISWSKENKSAKYKVEILQEQETVLSIIGKYVARFTFSMKDQASISNILNAIILALELSIPEVKIQEQLQYIRPISMRLELMKAPQNCLLINDSYNADLTSLQSALEFALMQKNKRGLTLIMSEFDGQINNQGFYDRLHKLIQSYAIDTFYYVGESHASLSYDMLFDNTSDLLKYLIKNKPQSELILIKGARRFKFETIASYLQENPHRTILQTKLSSVSKNIKYFRSLGAGEHKIMAVVKAGAYGSDSVRIGKHLENFGVDYLAVAYIEEGIELRNEGIKKPIMVMNPDPSLFSLAAEYDLELEIFSIEQLKEIDFLKTINIHINIDSGMNRLGFKKEQLSELIEYLLNNSFIKVQSIFSHLSSSDDGSKKAVSYEQDVYFNSCYDQLKQALDYSPIKHLCNSYGAIHFQEMHYDMIRVGIGMHGLIENDYLECSHRLISFVAQVKDVKKGESVGYNQGFIAERDMKTATISIGYADGINRRHGNGKSSYYINGVAYKTVGKIAMDTSIIDITGSNIQEGDEVVIFENKDQLFDLCKTGELIPYEMICGIGKRVARNSNIE